MEFRRYLLKYLRFGCKNQKENGQDYLRKDKLDVKIMNLLGMKDIAENDMMKNKMEILLNFLMKRNEEKYRAVPT